MVTQIHEEPMRTAEDRDKSRQLVNDVGSLNRVRRYVRQVEELKACLKALRYAGKPLPVWELTMKR